MLDLNEFKHEVHALAVEKGWYDTVVSADQAILMMHCEISEAVEAYRNGEGMERVCEELADVVLRVLDFSSYHDLPIENFRQCSWFCTNDKDFVEIAVELHILLTPLRYPTFLIAHIAAFCRTNGYNLDDLLLEKHEKNKTRPYRHGGKLL